MSELERRVRGTPGPQRPDLVGRRLFAAVAQHAFDSHAGDGIAVNTFCTLAPVLFDDGAQAGGADQFPNNGLIWWKLRAAHRPLTEPGRLLSIQLEHAPQYVPSDPNKEYYQAVSYDVSAIRTDEAIEILTLPDRAARRARDLVNVPGIVETDHPPIDRVLVRWCGSLYGPLQTRVVASHGGAHRVSLYVPPGETSILRIPQSALQSVADRHRRVANIRVSLDNQVLHRSSSTGVCSYELLLGDGFATLREAAEESVTLYRDDELIARAARRLLVRSDRQQLLTLLDRLQSQLGDAPEDVDTAEFIEATRRRAQFGSEGLTELAEGLLRSGLLAEPMEQVLERKAREHVEANAAALAAEIEAKVADLRQTLQRLERAREDVDAEIEAKRREAERELADRIETSWLEHTRRMAQEREELAKEREQLDEKARTLSGHLAEVARRFGDARGKVIDDFLALLPLLEKVMPGMMASGSGQRPEPASPAGETAAPSAPPPAEPFTVPPGLLASSKAEPQPDEAAFFERFVEHVRNAGFEYRLVDLQAFHLNAKCSDFTIVAGRPGTGKSSLPRLYAEALAGGAASRLEDDAPRYLHVAVRPDWQDLTDALGHVNLLEHSFQPALSGLFQQLVYAHEEHRRKAGESGLHLVCFDDMDLAPAENVLGVLLHVLQQPHALRRLRCFDARAVSPADPFRAWHTLPLPPSLRFTGTVADDDAVTALGPRILDRAGFLRLRSVRPRELHARAPAPATGVPVLWRTYRQWVEEAALPAAQAALLDRLEPGLAAIGARLTPRRYHRICRFVASARDVCPPHVAFDLQLAERVNARTRTLWGQPLEREVTLLIERLESEEMPFPETLHLLESMLPADDDGDE